MKIDVPCRHTAELGRLFADIGQPVRFVGGCVRDTLKNNAVKDIDLASPARPEVVLEAAEAAGYRVIPTGLQHGTVTVVIDGEGYEITTLRADVETDGRHATVAFVNDFETDAARRDFTFNAMSADLDGTVHDYFGGVDDLAAGRTMFVGNMDDRITEDYLRILRFYRFRARYGGSEPRGYSEGVWKHGDGLTRISGERIWSELSRIITVPTYAWPTVRELDYSGILRSCGLAIDGGDPRVSIALMVNRFAANRPAAILGMLARDAEALEAVSERWRLSTAERALSQIVLDIRRTEASERDSLDTEMYEPHFWIDRAVEGEPIEDIRTALYLLGHEFLAERLPSVPPVFPVKGQDLLDRGMKPGKQVGLKLRELKDAWKASRYTLDADELLADPTPAPIAGGPRP
ncbi:CCA tRNA nucleotidyltransferase [Rhizobium sp. BK176]|uniref:CCA tRNA nucleotidyltransferase n=1 Tax=Rhizobium sp. BK176 TaxID=2587071 RepID=UPI00216AA020|nr:CCA tRNA nucleotidyltransferase [Rhizobium sp. BK176]MCS4089544.1 poly(A) polymerase [Rhizobium sp. BK176]